MRDDEDDGMKGSGDELDPEKEDTKLARRPTIRPVSRISGVPFSKLRNTKCFPEIDRRIRLGWSVTDVVDMIQDEYQECTDISKKYLRKLLDDYRKSIPPAELSMASANSLVSRNATKAVAEGINEIEEIERLYKIQLKRIDIDFKNEEKIGKLLGGTGQQVYIAAKLLNQSAQLKMDLGLAKRQLGTVEVTGQLAAEASERYGKDSIGRVIADPDSRRKVLSLAERLMQLTAKASLDAVGVIGEVMQAKAEDEVASGAVIDVTPVEDTPKDDK